MRKASAVLVPHQKLDFLRTESDRLVLDEIIPALALLLSSNLAGRKLRQFARQLERVTRRPALEFQLELADRSGSTVRHESCPSSSATSIRLPFLEQVCWCGGRSLRKLASPALEPLGQQCAILCWCCGTLPLISHSNSPASLKDHRTLGGFDGTWIGLCQLCRTRSETPFWPACASACQTEIRFSSLGFRGAAFNFRRSCGAT